MVDLSLQPMTWEAPDPLAAEEHRCRSVFLECEGSLSRVELSHLSPLGVGLQLYFWLVVREAGALI